MPPMTLPPRTVSVTAEHIVQGRPLNSQRCPLALALTEASASDEKPRPSRALVNKAKALLFERWGQTDGEIVTSYTLPEDARAFVKRFDDDGAKAVAPATFTLEATERYNTETFDDMPP